MGLRRGLGDGERERERERERESAEIEREMDRCDEQWAGRRIARERDDRRATARARERWDRGRRAEPEEKKNQRRKRNENGFSVPTYYFSDFFILVGFEKAKTLLGPPYPPQRQLDRQLGSVLNSGNPIRPYRLIDKTMFSSLGRPLHV